jgi:hypothetical protein
MWLIEHNNEDAIAERSEIDQVEWVRTVTEFPGKVHGSCRTLPWQNRSSMANGPNLQPRSMECSAGFVRVEF